MNQSFLIVTVEENQSSILPTNTHCGNNENRKERIVNRVEKGEEEMKKEEEPPRGGSFECPDFYDDDDVSTFSELSVPDTIVPPPPSLQEAVSDITMTGCSNRNSTVYIFKRSYQDSFFYNEEERDEEESYSFNDTADWIIKQNQNLTIMRGNTRCFMQSLQEERSEEEHEQKSNMSLARAMKHNHSQENLRRMHDFMKNREGINHYQHNHQQRGDEPSSFLAFSSLSDLRFG